MRVRIVFEKYQYFLCLYQALVWILNILPVRVVLAQAGKAVAGPLHTEARQQRTCKRAPRHPHRDWQLRTPSFIVTTIDNQCEPSPQATFAYFGCTALIHSHQSHQPPVDLRSSYKTSRASSLSFPHHGANQSSQCPRSTLPVHLPLLPANNPSHSSLSPKPQPPPARRPT